MSRSTKTNDLQLLATQAQREKIAKARRLWEPIKAAYEQQDIIEFFQAYVDYLNEQNVLSERREMLRNMLQAVVEYADSEEGEESGDLQP